MQGNDEAIKRQQFSHHAAVKGVIGGIRDRRPQRNLAESQRDGDEQVQVHMLGGLRMQSCSSGERCYGPRCVVWARRHDGVPIVDLRDIGVSLGAEGITRTIKVRGRF